MEHISGQEVARLRQLADGLECITEDDLQLLADVTPGTSEAWRKRGQGPAFIRIGNRVLYQRKAVADFLESRKRERTALGKALL